jgi:ATP-binding cassette subfamily B (MDR/TAP) protein 1
MSASQVTIEDAPTPVVDAKDGAATGVAAVAPPPPFFRLWRFASPLDVALTLVSILCGLAHGVVMPLFSVLFGQIINSLNADDLDRNIRSLCLQLMGVAIAAGVAAYFQFALANVTAVRQVRALRRAYVAALLRQDVAWYDANPPGDLAARLVEDTVAIEDGLGAKFSLLSQSFATFIAGITVAFSLSWKMSLVLLGFLPLLGGAMAAISTMMLGAQKKGTDAYAEAGEVATEALSNIRTVAAYGGEGAVAARYEAALHTAEKEGVKKATLTGVTVGSFLLVMFVVYGTCLLWGAQLVLWDRQANLACYDPTTSGCFVGGTVMQVLFALIMGAGALGQCAPAVTALAAARAAAGRVWALVDRVPPIDSAPAAAPAAAPAIAAGRIEFRGVTFAYPARPTVPVLKDFSLVVEAGERLALVGPSGCGKSTLVALIQRWYDVDAGAVLIDGVDVRDMPVQALRRAQALVSQESLLLSGSAALNIELGALPAGGAAGPAVVVDGEGGGGSAAVRAAAAAANAAAFIEALPQGFATALTNNSLSGGQRQRVCIARALMRGGAPILLLDEATSALDSASEAAVQAALDGLLAAGGAGGARRTTITIAHRLSTIDNADRVVVLRDGEIVESGAPAALMGKEGGIFRAMREAQAMSHGSGAEAAAAGGADAPAAAAPAAAPAAADAAAAATPKPAGAGVEKEGEGSGEAAAALIAGEPPAAAVPFLRVARINGPEWGYALGGLLCCAAAGLTMPAFSLILSKFISIYFDPDNAALWRNAIFYMGMFFLIAGGNFVASIGQQFCFGVMGERLVRRVRVAAFASLLRFEVAWHDAHSAGSVAAALGADAALLKAATGPSLALQLQTAIGLVAGLVIAFTASWRITLVVLAIAPLIAVGGAIQIKMMTGGLEDSKKAFEECGAVATEALSAPRTVAAYGLQGATLAAFDVALNKPTKANIRAAWASGIGMSIMAT